MRPALALLAAAVLAACGSREPVGGEGAEARGTAGTDTIALTGVVVLAEGAPLPEYPANPMIDDRPGRRFSEDCPPPQRGDRQPVRRSASGGLSNVVVALSEFERMPPHEATTHEIRIERCRLTPATVTATVGDTVRVVNATDYPFLLGVGRDQLNQMIAPEAERVLPQEEPGVTALQCGFASPCGVAQIVTLSHPLHAVTDADGRFRIEGVREGEEIRLSAWHPLFQESARTVVARAGEELRFELAPQPSRVPAAAEGAAAE
jgi:hypothetical protein